MLSVSSSIIQFDAIVALNVMLTRLSSDLTNTQRRTRVCIVFRLLTFHTFASRDVVFIDWNKNTVSKTLWKLIYTNIRRT